MSRNKWDMTKWDYNLEMNWSLDKKYVLKKDLRGITTGSRVELITMKKDTWKNRLM